MFETTPYRMQVSLQIIAELHYPVIVMRTSRTALFVRSTGIEAAVVAPTAGYARPKCMPMDEPGL
jgi:hypothetical protein